MYSKNNAVLKKMGFVIVVVVLTIGLWFNDNPISNMYKLLQQISATSEEVSSITELPKYVIPGGDLVGVRIISDGIYVVGTSEIETDSGIENPCKHKIFKGDRIYAINNQSITSKDDLKKTIEKNTQEELIVTLKRDDKQQDVTITPVYSREDQTYRIGLWVKDGIQGIGTVTYINPETKEFGALGHGINDSEIKTLVPIKTGEIIPTEITTIIKGQRGDPGQLSGVIEYTKEKVLGEVYTNAAIGIYGKVNEKGLHQLTQNPIPIAQQSEIIEGPATLLSSLMSEQVNSYDIIIEKVSHYSTEPSKGMVIKIVDNRLLDITNGIVQGMSGSPIIQNGKLVGAVTHVFVNDPTKGYGIFIENMLQNTSH